MPDKVRSVDEMVADMKKAVEEPAGRKEYAKKKKLPAPSELHPRLVTCDAGPEFRGYFEKGVGRLREAYKKTEKGKTTYPFYNIGHVREII